MKLPPEVLDLFKRYGLASALAGLALLIRDVLPAPEGTSIYELPLVAVVLSAWFGGRGPGLFASLICIAATHYRFVPPLNTFELSPDHALGFFIFVALCLFLGEFSAGRRRAAHALGVSEERFRALVQFSFDVYWETDAEHRFTLQEFSEQLTDAPARGAEIGKTRWEIPYVGPDEEAWRKHRATLDAHLPFRDFELARPTADGGTRYVSVSGIPVFDPAGRFVGYRGVGRHITERKRAEQEHRAHLWFLESMDRINRAIQGSDDLDRMMDSVLEAALDVFVCDRAWLIYPCDPDAPSWHAVMEHTRPEFPGAFALQAELPVDRDVAAAFAAARAAPGAVLFGPNYDLKIPALAADRFAVRSQMAMAIDAKADKPYLLGLHQCSGARLWTAEEQRLFQEIGRRLSDGISALSMLRSLRDNERKLDAAQRIAHVGWWERDFATKRVSLSDEAQRIFGVAPVDLPQWQDRWVNLIHPEDRARVTEAAAAAMDGGPRYDVEYRVIRPDGAVRVVHSQGDVARDESGRPVRQFGVMQDITELRRAEDELSEIRERFRVLAESSLTGIYLTEQDRFTYVNPALAKMFGYEVEEVVGRLGSVDLTCPDDRPLVAENMRRRLEGEVEEMRYEFRGLRKDGSVFPVEVHGRRIEHGGKIGVLGTLVDNTERKRAEDELRATETYLEEAQRLSHTGSWALDLVSNKYIYTSDESDRIYGFDPEAEPPTREAVFERIHPEDRSSWKQNFERSLREKVDVSDEYRIVLPDGRVRHIHAIRHPVLNGAGDVVKLIGTSIDITERKAAEEELRASEARFRTFVEGATDGFFLIDDQGRVVDVNRQACESLGFTREELIGMHPHEFDVGLEEAAIERLAERARTGETFMFETRHRRKDGTTFPVEIRVARLQQGGKLFNLALVRDITERKLAEESLRQSEAYLAESQRLSHTGSWALDVASNRYVYTSEEFDRLFGFDPQGEAPTREAVLERMHPDDRISWDRILEKSVREKLDTSSQYRIVLPDGSIRHIHTIRHPVVNSAGDVVKLVGTSIDITERTAAEEELRASEARFRTFVDHARDSFFLMNEQLTVVDVNRQACVSLGYRREELIGMHPRDFDAGLDDPAIAALAQRAGAGETLTFETVHRRKDGTVFPVEIRSGRFEQGGQLFYLALVRDISERKRVEAELRARQDMLDLAQKAARALAFDWYIGARESENRWSPELEAMYGLEPGTFDGTYQGWKKLLHPDDWPAVKLAIQRSHESGDIAAEYRVIHKDGSVHWLRAKGRMFFDAEGRPARMVGFMLDVTDQRQAEEELRMTDVRFRTLVDLAPDAFMLHGQDGTVIDVNRQACEALGYARQELIGKKPVDFDVGLDVEAVRLVTTRIAAGETVTFETRHRRKDGTVFPVEVRGRQLPQADSWIGVSLSRDITERKRVEQERERLRQLEADLARMSRIITMGELTASIAHEVNQPLGAMVANAAACERWLAARRPETEKVRRALKSIAADGQRASAVIGRIRALMKRQAPRRDALDLSEAIREVLALTQQELQRHQIVLATRFDEHLPPVRADKVQLQQVLLNLVVNAIEAMSAVDVRPRELTIVSAQDGPESVLVEVRDSGPGLEAGQAERLFEAFYTTKDEGMGIGLAISRSIVEAHGGRLSAAPNAPHGTVFRFSLPADA